MVGFAKLGWLRRPYCVGLQCECRGVPLTTACSSPQGFEGLTQRIAEHQAEREARAAAVRAEEEERRLKECSFAPDINRSRVEAKVRGWRGWTGCASLEKCGMCHVSLCASRHSMGLDATFRPPASNSAWTNPPHTSHLAPSSPSMPQGPVVVRGLDRHLELRQLAERQRVEAEARAARVFHANPRAKQGATVPQPFQLRGHALLEVRR